MLIADVRAIAGKKGYEVEQILGKPDSTYFLQILGKRIFCQLYKPHLLEIQYPNGIATDIVAYAPKGLVFNQTALSAFNLDHRVHPNEFMEGRLIRWNTINPFSSVSFYNPTLDSLGNIVTFNVYFKVAE